LAKNNCTPADFWLGLPLVDLPGWIKANNEIISDQNKK